MDKNRRPERAQRIELDQEVTLITSDGHPLRAVLKDLSRDGFKLGHAGEDLVVGEIVTIKTARSESRAQLLWVSETEAGGSFIEDVKPVR